MTMPSPEAMAPQQATPQLALGAGPSLTPPQPPDPSAYPVNSYDNHAVHILYHNRFRKGQQFEGLPDEVKKVFEKHVQAHQMALQAGMVPQGLSDGAYEGYNSTDANNAQARPAGTQPQGQPMSAPGGLAGVLGMKGAV